MKIGFGSKRLERIANSEKAARKFLPANITPIQLFRRLQELSAFPCMGEIPFRTTPLHFHPLRGNFAGKYAVTLHGLWRIVFEPYGEYCTSEDGTPDLATVTEILITSVENYHQ